MGQSPVGDSRRHKRIVCLSLLLFGENDFVISVLPLVMILVMMVDPVEVYDVVVPVSIAVPVEVRCVLEL